MSILAQAERKKSKTRASHLVSPPKNKAGGGGKRGGGG